MLKRLSPYILLAGLGLLFFGKLVFHPTGVLFAPHSDFLAYSLPAQHFLVRSFQETGKLPLWCPYWFGGMPFVADVQVEAFYPLHLPLYWMPESWLAAARSWLLVIHVIIAGWCMHAYARHRGLEGTAALVAAIGYMFAAKWLVNILVAGHFVLAPLAWLPLVLLLLERAITRGSLVPALWAGAVFSLIVLATHPQLTFYSGVFIAFWTLGPAFDSRIEGRHRRRFLIRWLTCGLATVVTTVALCAVQLLPAMESAREATRGSGYTALDFAGIFWPAFLNLVGPGWTDGWDEVIGLNLLWLAAAIAAPFFLPGRTRYEAGVALGMLAFAMGGDSLVHWLPGFGLFQIPIRMAILLALPIALLAGRTTQILLAEISQRLPARRVLSGVLKVGLLMAVLDALAHAFAPGQRSGAWLTDLGLRHWLYWLILAGTAPSALWLLSRRCSLSSTRWQVTWVAVLLADAWSMSWPNMEVRDPQSVYPISAGVQYLAEKRRENPLDHWRVLDRGVPGFPSTAALGPSLPLFGQVKLEPVLSYNPIDVRRYKEYLQFIEDKDEPIAPGLGIFGYPIIQPFPIENKSLLDLLGARYTFAFVDENLCFQAAGEPGKNLGWEKLPIEDVDAVTFSFLAGGMQPVPAYTIYQNIQAFPRAFTLTRALPLADRPSVLAQLKTTNFHHEVLLEGSFPVIETSDRDDDFRPAQIMSYAPERVEIATDRPEPSYLVLTDVWFPGWKCTVDGSPTEIYRANFLFRAISLPAGKHEIVFSFEPESYRVGKIVSACGLVVLLAATSANVLRRKTIHLA